MDGAHAIDPGAVALGAELRSSDPVAPIHDDDSYARLYPYYAEVCALSEIRKRSGFGVEFRSGVGGHSILYLSGVCRDRRAGHPRLKLCEPDAQPASHGVGISVNSHYRNANWVATEGRSFVFHGALRPGERLTRHGYERTQAQAKAMGVLDGVEFHAKLFERKPPGMSPCDYMYEISVATDYAVTFGRTCYAARVPLDRARMSAAVDFLNSLNAPYRDGNREFRWSIFNNNCSHVAHNALAAAGLWAPWPTGQLVLFAAFNFPVPKNEFVDLMLRTNDLPIDDPHQVYGDEAARRLLVDAGTLPTAPGGLARAVPALRDNEIYDTDRLRLIFYDNPFWGPYRPRFSRIFAEPRYFDLQTNLKHFQMLYESAQENRRAAKSRGPGRRAARQAGGGELGRFLECYDSYIERQAAKVQSQLAALDDAADSVMTCSRAP